MAELVAGAFLSTFLQALFDRMASPEVVDFIKGRKLSAELLSTLKTTLNTVNGLIDDAEEQQITKRAVKDWLDELKHAVYDADDLLDEIAYESLRSKLEPTKHFFSSRNPFGKRMDCLLEEILAKLNHLVDQKQALCLHERIGEKPASQKIQTTSVVYESDVFGRDDDREALMKLLLSNDPNGRNVGVIPIVGLGGVGKTTLAQLLYNDSRVQAQFDLRGWICVSDEFDVLKLSRAVLEEFTGKKWDTTSLNQLQLNIKDELTGKKFFLVLDDVWNENDSKWESLQTPFKFAARGSKIVVTTRNESVASVMRTTTPHHLQQLDAENCWALFAKCASGNADYALHPDLVDIGRRIVAKCQGLPLAAKSLGDLLRSKGDDKEWWERVLGSKLWDLPNNNILPALRLSYHYLPSHLKCCFAYCALFPKDYVFGKTELISLWIAEGFLDQSKGKMEKEELGNEYLKELVTRSFFQQKDADEPCFIMHDLMHDLADFVSREFCSRLEGGDSFNIPEKTRHLSYVRTVMDEEMRRIIKLTGDFKGQYVRTILFSKEDWMSRAIDNEAMDDLLSSLECVRILSLSGYKQIDKLPDSIGSLKHLRHLNLSGASFTSLPESVSSLYNLHTLILFRCQNLIELPTKTGRLINLTHLDTRETGLRKMPQKMGNLTKLQVLTLFIVGKSKKSRASVKELGKLKHLRGELSIQDLQNVDNAQAALEANMKVKERLKKLEFKWAAGETKNPEHVRDVLESLQPHVNMECLSITGYGGTRFPSWVEDLNFSNTVSLTLNECENCRELPPLERWTSLKKLSIAGFDKVTSMGFEFRGSRVQMPFSSLQILSLERMPEWQEWRDEGRAFPLLRELYVRECPKLSKNLPSQLPSLKVLVVEACSQLAFRLPRAAVAFQMTLEDDVRQMKISKLSSGLCSLQVEKFHSAESLTEILQNSNAISTSLEEIEIKGSSSFKFFPLESFPNLKRVDCFGCQSLEALFTLPKISQNSVAISTSLEVIEIAGSSSLKFFPLESFPNLKRLAFYGCQSLEALSALDFAQQYSKVFSDSFPILEIYIRDCPLLLVATLLPWAPITWRIEIYDTSRYLVLRKLPSGLHSLELRKFYSSEVIKMDRLCSVFTNLEELIVRDNNTLRCFPLELFPKLERVHISGCPNLQSFYAPQATQGDLISLCSLEIMKCPGMISIAKEGLGTLNLYSVPLRKPPNIHEIIIKGGSWCCMTIKRLFSGLHALEINNFHSTIIEEVLIIFRDSLEEIDARNCNSLKRLPIESSRDLKKLAIQRCPNFESLGAAETSQTIFPALTELIIGKCPQFVSFPKGELHAPKLANLTLWSSSNLKSLPERMPLLLPSLMKLSIHKFPHLRYFPGENSLPSSLEFLDIHNLESLISLEYMQLKRLTTLKEVHIFDCPRLQSPPECLKTLFPSLVGLSIGNCPEFESILNRGLPSNLKSLDISWCNNHSYILLEPVLRTLHSLSFLGIGGFDDVHYFPEEMSLPPNLATLEIRRLENLKGLCYKGLEHLTSLTVLRIYSCPQLLSLPEEGLPSSLSAFIISGCPLLEEQCKPDEGKYWPKISRIPHVSLPL